MRGGTRANTTDPMDLMSLTGPTSGHMALPIRRTTATMAGVNELKESPDAKNAMKKAGKKHGKGQGVKEGGKSDAERRIPEAWNRDARA